MNKCIILYTINYLSGKGVETGCDNINASWTDSLKKEKKNDKLTKPVLKPKYLLSRVKWKTVYYADWHSFGTMY